MKLLAMIPLLPMAAFAVTVELLPQGEYADTEVSTNVANCRASSWRCSEVP